MKKNNVLFVELRKKTENFKINFSELDKLKGKTISLASTIQYLDFLPIIKSYLEKQGKKVIIKKGPAYPGHVIGCKSFAFDSKADNLLLLADGKFHALNNALDLNRDIWIFNLKTLDSFFKQDLEKIEKRKKIAMTKFLLSTSVGLIVSTKSGQNYPLYNSIKEKLEKKGKKVYVLETDNLNLQDLDNFSLPSYINTACPGLFLDDEQNRIINIKDVLGVL